MFIQVWAGFIIYRFCEMIVSYLNSKSHNLREIGKIQKIMMLSIHTMWFLSMIVENYYIGASFHINLINVIIITLLSFASILRIISILTLKKMWSTKVFALRKEDIVHSGIYKYFRHPNYFAVFLEILLFPLLFNLYYTAMVFTLFNSVFLFFSN